MKISSKLVWLSLICLSLAACDKKTTYDYLISHPDDLKSEFDKCERHQSTKLSEHCTVVMQAHTNFIDMLAEFQHGPDLFGQKILAAEEDLGKKEEAWKLFQASHSNGATDEASKAEAQTLKQEYDAQKNRVAAMLAVVSLFSPE